jgi:hypothetical protein
MPDSLDPAATRGLWWRVAALFAAFVAVAALACVAVVAVFDATHPAPLGRSRKAMLARVDRALPPGTTVDSAERFLRAVGVRFERYPPDDAARAFPHDSLLAGGPVLLALQPGAARDIYVWDGAVTLYFGPDGRLVRRAAELSAESPL